MKRIVLALLLTVALHANAQLGEHFLVTQHQVAHALLLHGLGIAEDQVSLVANIVARSDNPELDIDSMQPLGARAEDSQLHARLKLVCHEPRECLPFYVNVVVPPGTVLLPPATPERKVRAPAAPICMHAGSKATLLVETAHMHISVPVISLQDGAIGAQIHVTSPDHHQTWTATILSPTLLTGSL